jgi:hypothetical protein
LISAVLPVLQGRVTCQDLKRILSCEYQSFMPLTTHPVAALMIQIDIIQESHIRTMVCCPSARTRAPMLRCGVRTGSLDCSQVGGGNGTAVCLIGKGPVNLRRFKRCFSVPWVKGRRAVYR